MTFKRLPVSRLTAHDAQALEAVLAKAQQPGQVLCAQPLRLSAQGACRWVPVGLAAQLCACAGRLVVQQALAGSSPAALPPGHPSGARFPLVPGCCRALEAGVGQLAAALPAPHPLLPTHSCGLVAVSCTAKGRQMFKDVGVEAGAIHAATRGVGRGRHAHSTWIKGGFRYAAFRWAASCRQFERLLPGNGRSKRLHCPAVRTLAVLVRMRRPGTACLQLPLAGVYCDGEIGPTVLNAKSALHWAGDGSGSDSAATSCAGQGGAGTRHAGRSTLQGFTTILTALSGAN